MNALARIRANGGSVVRDQWRFTLRPGRLSTEAVAWIRTHWLEICGEAWPDFDRWSERAAIKEFDGGMTRLEAEAEAYEEISGC